MRTIINLYLNVLISGHFVSRALSVIAFFQNIAKLRVFNFGNRGEVNLIVHRSPKLNIN